MAKKIRNPYKIPQGYVFDPFDVLYNSPSPEEVNLQPFAEELRDYALLMDENIAGDFNLENMIYEIKENNLSFVRNGLITFKVKFFKLYKKGYKSFQDFCERAIGMSHWYVNRLMQAARVVLKLALNGFTTLPTCEAQARPLTKLNDCELCEKWQEIVESFPAHKITTARIMEVLGQESSVCTVRFNKKEFAEMKEAADAMNLSVQDYILLLHHKNTQTTAPDEEKIKAWEEDLENLIEEYEESQQDNKEDSEEHGSQQEDSKTVPIGTKNQSEVKVETEVKSSQNDDSEPSSSET